MPVWTSCIQMLRSVHMKKHSPTECSSFSYSDSLVLLYGLIFRVSFSRGASRASTSEVALKQDIPHKATFWGRCVQLKQACVCVVRTAYRLSTIQKVAGANVRLLTRADSSPWCAAPSSSLRNSCAPSGHPGNISQGSDTTQLLYKIIKDCPQPTP